MIGVRRRRHYGRAQTVTPTLVIDPSSPGTLATTAATSVTSPTFSPPAGSLIVIVYANAGSVGTGITITSITDNGPGLTYKKLVGRSGSQMDAEIWCADCPAHQINMTVTAHITSTQDAMFIGVIVLTGAAAANSQNGATATNLSAPASVALTTTQPGSWVFGVISDNSTNTAPTIPSGQTDVFNGFTYRRAPTGFSSFWSQAPTSATPASGTGVTINDTGPADSCIAVAVEILA